MYVCYSECLAVGPFDSKKNRKRKLTKLSLVRPETFENSSDPQSEFLFLKKRKGKCIARLYVYGNLSRVERGRDSGPHGFFTVGLAPEK